MTANLIKTKADEIEYLQNLVDNFKNRQETYLAELFSDNLIGWFTQQLRADFPTDLADQFTKVSAALTEQTLAAENAEQRAGMWEASFKHLQEVSQASIDGFNGERIKLQAHIDQRKTFCESQLDAANRVVADRDQQILILKARLYDIEHAE